MTNTSMHLRLPAGHDAWLTEQAQLRGVSKTYLICRALDTLRELEPSPTPIGIQHAPIRRIERVS